MSLLARTVIASSLSAAGNTTTLSDVCTTSNVQTTLPANGTLLGISLVPSAVTANAVYNASTGIGGGMGGTSSSGGATYSYCNVTVKYTHTGKGDEVVVKYAFPEPSEFKNRFYVAGGGGFSLSSDATGGLEYGAASGATSAGYDAFDYSYDEKVLYGNGSINWDATYAFSYQALGEMTKLGKYITGKFYGMNSSKLYTYFEGCSDGGREGMSQVQRWGEEYDGAITGAPAFRFAQQQVLHVFPATIEHTMGYYPPPCALKKIVNATIAACDPLDGRTDGVISRTDLCKLNFNLNSLIGESYYCAGTTSSSLGFGSSSKVKRVGPPSQNNSTSGGPSSGGTAAQGSKSSTTPTQNGTITAQDIAVAQAIYSGLHNSEGQRAYLSWQIGSDLGDGDTTFNNNTSSWELNIPSTGGEYVTKFVQLLDVDNLSNLDGVTYDTLVEWMTIGMYRYLDSLQTTLPDLTAFKNNGGKLLHYHGESDPSVPSASSSHYWYSVLDTMYPQSKTNIINNNSKNKSRNKSRSNNKNNKKNQKNSSSFDSATDRIAQLSEWYQFYLVPGAAHCGVNSLQPGPYPQNNMDVMIDWVENGIKPERLNATVSSGANEGETQILCQWPSRPLWRGNDTSEDGFDCVHDEKSIESWQYEFPAFKLPVY